LPRRRPPVAKHDQRTARTVEAATDKIEPEIAKNQGALLEAVTDDVDRQQDRNATAAESPPDRAEGLQANLTEGQGGISGLSGTGQAGQGSDRPGSGAPGAESDYFQELSRWLEKHKRYPRRSKLRNEQGVVLLRLVVTQSGDVSAFKIVEGSGYQRLDKEVADMIDRAKPLPAIPDALQQTSISVLLPVGFLLR
jgi:protein TonB